MSKLNLKVVMVKGLLCLVLLLAITGCDGGLFGTGDGSDIIVEPPVAAPPIDAGGQNGPETGEPDEPNDTVGSESPPSAPDNSEDVIPSQVFQNQLATGSNQLALVTLVNTSTQPLNIVSGDSAIPLLNDPVLSGLSSKHVELAENTSTLEIVNADTLQTLFRFSSLELGPSSVSTLLAHNSPSPSNTPGDSNNIDVIALRSRTSSIDPSVATVRLVQANQLGDSDRAASMLLLPAGSNPGSGEVVFNDVSLADAAQSEYTSVNAGTYQLQDSLDRFEAISLSLEASLVYTLIITGNTDPVLIIEQDSDIAIQSGPNQ